MHTLAKPQTFLKISSTQHTVSICRESHKTAGALCHYMTFTAVQTWLSHSHQPPAQHLKTDAQLQSNCSETNALPSLRRAFSLLSLPLNNIQTTIHQTRMDISITCTTIYPKYLLVQFFYIQYLIQWLHNLNNTVPLANGSQYLLSLCGFKSI